MSARLRVDDIVVKLNESVNRPAMICVKYVFK